MKPQSSYIWLDVLRFFKKPIDQKDVNQKVLFKTKQLFSVLIFDVIVVSVIAFLIVLAEEYGLVSTDTHIMNEWQLSMSKWYILFLGVIIAPLFEEIIFRLYLRKRYNPIRLVSFIAGLISPSSRHSVKESIDRNWHKYYGIFFYVAAIVFGLVHIFNYKLSSSVLLFMPLLIAPQVTAGLFMGYMRVRFGLWWSILLHALHNFIFLGISVLYMYSPVTDFRIEDETYFLEVNTSGNDNSSSTMSLPTKDTIIFDNVKFKSLMANLMNTEETFIKIEPDYVNLENISLKFISLNDSVNFREIVLKDLQEQYDFKVLKDTINEQGWELNLSDRGQLYQNESRSAENRITIVNSDSITMTMVKLNELVKTLNLNYDEIIFTEIDNNDQFDFKLPKADFEVLKQELKEKYGLELKTASTEVEIITLQFNE